MKNTTIIISFLLIFFFSCSNRTNKKEFNSNVDIPTIPVDMDATVQPINNIFEKIELIPLETHNESLLGSIANVIYVPDKYYITQDHLTTIAVFDNKGKYISNSMKVKGIGPREYFQLSDMAYNYFTDNIELLTPGKAILSYDINFNFLSRKKIEIDNISLFVHLYPISKTIYVLLPFKNLENSNIMYFYDSENNKILNSIEFDFIVKTSMSDNPIVYIDKEFTFNPPVSTYLGYAIDCNTHSLIPQYKLDFLDHNINKEEIRRFADEADLSNYMMFESPYALPLNKFHNSNYIVTLIRKDNEYFAYIYSHISKQGKLIEVVNKDKKSIPMIRLIDDDYLVCIVEPFLLDKHIDKSLLDQSNLKIFNSIGEDDNPIIVKYKLNF